MKVGSRVLSSGLAMRIYLNLVESVPRAAVMYVAKNR